MRLKNGEWKEVDKDIYFKKLTIRQKSKKRKNTCRIHCSKFNKTPI